jgi:hypothetical protein
MSDLSTSPGLVLPGGNAVFRKGTAGDSITAAEPVYYDTDTDRYKKADNTSGTGTATTSEVAGIAAHAAFIGQPLTIVEEGNFQPGATLATGTVYVSSGANSGGIAPVADLGTGDWTSVLGVATSTVTLKVDIINSGKQIP